MCTEPSMGSRDEGHDPQDGLCTIGIYVAALDPSAASQTFVKAAPRASAFHLPSALKSIYLHVPRYCFVRFHYLDVKS